jgi:hypothetical protein
MEMKKYIVYVGTNPTSNQLLGSFIHESSTKNKTTNNKNEDQHSQ